MRVRNIRGAGAAISFMLSLFCAPPLLAHGGGTPQLTDEPVGPYRVYVWTQPEPLRMGDVHLTVAVTRANSASDGGEQEAVSDAKVTLQFIQVDSNEQPLIVEAHLQESLGGLYYEVDTVLPTDGEWEITVAVDGALGDGIGTFQVSALPTTTINYYVLGGGAMLFLALLGILALRRRSGSEQPSRMQKKTARQAI